MIKPISLLPFIMAIWCLFPFGKSINIDVNPSYNASPRVVSGLVCKAGIVIFYDVDKQGATVYASDLYTSPATTTCTSPNSNITYIVADSFNRYQDSIVLGLNDLFNTNCLFLIAKDACGDSIRCKVLVQFLDTIPPKIKCPSLRDTVYCSEANLPAPYNFASFIAAGGMVMDETYASTMTAATLWSKLPDRSTRKGCFKEIERRYRVKDFFDNADTCSQFFNVSDTMIVKCPKDTIVQTALGLCYGNYVPVLSLAANCTRGTTVTHNGPVNNRYPIGLTTVTFTAISACNDTAKCSFVVTVMDKERPSITCPTNITTSCSAPVAFTTLAQFTIGGGTASDNCTLSNSIGATDVPGLTTCPTVVSRTYKIFDVHGNSNTCIQTITLNDNIIPTIATAPNITVGTSATTCDATVSLTQPVLGDNCTPIANLVLTRIPATNIFPKGNTIVTWKVTDLCGNTNTTAMTVTVNDDDSPNLTCKGPLDFNLSNGSNTISVDSLILSTTDNCPGTLTKVVRRMNATTCNPLANQFGATTSFCCLDVNTTVQVIVQVTDVNNNSSTCMVTVAVKDKLKPKIVEPLRDITVSCDYKIVLNDLEDFGSYVLKQSDRQVIDLDDALFDLLPGMFLDGLIDENCTADVDELAPLDQRGPHNNGNIIRRFVVTDQSGNSVTANQTITIIDKDPLTLADITWPPAYTYSDCNATPPTPAVSGSPTFNADDICTVPAATFKDQIFDDPTSGCIYIRRKWKVIDWAQFVPNTNIGIWERIQDIHLTNNVKPIFKPSSCVNKTICATNSNCDVLVALGVDATDDCTDLEDLVYDYNIDYDSNGSIDFTGLGDTLNYIASRGNHLVTWRVEDKCGNRQTCRYTVTAKECKTPTPVCLYGLSTNLENDGTATIWAKDFNNKSYDNCTTEGDLQFSFSANVNDVFKTLTCANRGNFNVELWVTDKDGNQSKCNTFIAVTDNKNICPTNTNNNNTISIAGRVITEDQVSIKEIDVNINCDGVTKRTITDEQGNFILPSLEMYKNYEIVPHNNKNWTQGISTLDLVMVQRHVLGASKLTSPYKIIAADANNDQKVSVADIVALRKLVLGQDNNIANNNSWRFVKKSYVFPDPKNPWPFDESAVFNALDNSQMSTDFYAIKIGDINGTVSSAKNNLASNRSAESKDIIVKDIYFAEGRYLNVPVSFATNMTLNAMQLNIIINNDILEFRGVMAEGIALNEEDYHYNTATGELRIVNINTKSVNLKQDAVLFTLQFKAKAADKLSQVINTTASGNFVLSDKDEAMDLTLRYADEIEPLVVNQNVPNPFESYTDVKYFLSDKSKVELTIYNASGLSIFNSMIEGKVGENTLHIDREQLGENTGIFFLHLATGERREIRKLLRLN